jgi:hypothetical protein
MVEWMRQLRIQYSDASYHPPPRECGATSIVSRGVRRKDLYVDDADRQGFLKAQADASHNGTNPSRPAPIADYFDGAS